MTWENIEDRLSRPLRTKMLTTDGAVSNCDDVDRIRFRGLDRFTAILVVGRALHIQSAGTTPCRLRRPSPFKRGRLCFLECPPLGGGQREAQGVELMSLQIHFDRIRRRYPQRLPAPDPYRLRQPEPSQLQHRRRPVALSSLLGVQRFRW